MSGWVFPFVSGKFAQFGLVVLIFTEIRSENDNTGLLGLNDVVRHRPKQLD